MPPSPFYESVGEKFPLVLYECVCFVFKSQAVSGSAVGLSGGSIGLEGDGEMREEMNIEGQIQMGVISLRPGNKGNAFA